MATAVTRGRFAWHELMTPDPEAAIEFYRQVVGWGIEQFPRQADALGGRARIPATSVPGVGRYAILADLQGIVFSLYTPETPRPTSEKADIGDFSWHELAAPDPSSAWSFYQA